MTVIVGIAIANLLLGFATAVLMGRGPKRWSEVEKCLVLKPISIGRARPAVSTVTEPMDLSFTTRPLPDVPEPDGSESVPELPGESTEAAETLDVPARELADTLPGDKAQAVEEVASDQSTTHSTAAAISSPALPPDKKLKLPLKGRLEEQQAASPEATLNHQINSWRQGDFADEVPSLSGIQFEVVEPALDDSTLELLSKALHARVRDQVRKDRRVLRIDLNQVIWFSADAPPEDALLPVERIRQMLTCTHLQHEGLPVVIEVVAGVVATLPDDDAVSLLKRLQAAHQHSRGESEHATSLDTGHGPLGIEAYDIEVAESECDF